MSNFVKFVRGFVSDKALCEAIISGYNAYLDASAAGAITESTDQHDAQLASSGTFDRDGNFTRNDSRKAAQNDSVPTKSILNGTPLASSGTFDMNGVFTDNDSMKAALMLAEEIRKEGAASGDDPTETKYWKIAQVVKDRLVQSGKKPLLDVFIRGINSKMRQFGVKFN